MPKFCKNANCPESQFGTPLKIVVAVIVGGLVISWKASQQVIMLITGELDRTSEIITWFGLASWAGIFILLLVIISMTKINQILTLVIESAGLPGLMIAIFEAASK